MPFQAETSRAPTSLGNIKITLADRVDPEVVQAVSAEIQVKDASGKIMKVWTGRLEDIIAPGVANSLLAQINAIRTQAANELIP